MPAWQQVGSLPSKSYTCGHCDHPLSSNLGWYAKDHNIINGVKREFSCGWIYLCHHCNCPTFFEKNGTQIPGSAEGLSVSGISDSGVKNLYEEARRAISVNAFTASVLACRKLLMHIAVAKGATQGLSFLQYVEFLSDKHFIPPDAKGWVDHIRSKGNEANHEIAIMDQIEAKRLITFCGILLKMMGLA